VHKRGHIKRGSERRAGHCSGCRLSLSLPTASFLSVHLTTTAARLTPRAHPTRVARATVVGPTFRVKSWGVNICELWAHPASPPGATLYLEGALVRSGPGHASSGTGVPARERSPARCGANRAIGHGGQHAQSRIGKRLSSQRQIAALKPHQVPALFASFSLLLPLNRAWWCFDRSRRTKTKASLPVP